MKTRNSKVEIRNKFQSLSRNDGVENAPSPCPSPQREGEIVDSLSNIRALPVVETRTKVGSLSRGRRLRSSSYLKGEGFLEMAGMVLSRIANNRERKFEPETTASCGRGLNADSAIHAFHSLGRESQPDTDARAIQS